MRIAFTHNLRKTNAEEEAEFDNIDTVNAITAAITKLGHEVRQIDVSQPLIATLKSLMDFKPSLIFNTAEGKIGKIREGFYPALFESLGMPYTGSDGYTCALTLDKQRTKSAVAEKGIPVVKGYFLQDANEEIPPMKYPLIIKPNFEGSSKGITLDSIIEEPKDLKPKIKNALKKYPEGILIEEYISGKDVTVPFLEMAPKNNGVLAPAEYLFDKRIIGERKYQIYDYSLKNTYYDAVEVKVPANISKELHKKLMEASRGIIKALNIRDAARIDYRVTPNGEFYFIEINALPSLEPGASIYVSASKVGMHTVESVLGKIIESATRRHQIRV